MHFDSCLALVQSETALFLPSFENGLCRDGGVSEKVVATKRKTEEKSTFTVTCYHITRFHLPNLATVTFTESQFLP